MRLIRHDVEGGAENRGVVLNGEVLYAKDSPNMRCNQVVRQELLVLRL